MNKSPAVTHISSHDINVETLAELCRQQTRLDDYPLAKKQDQNVLIYDRAPFTTTDPGARHSMLSEIHRALSTGPGVIVIQQAYDDLAIVDRHSRVFNRIMEQEAEGRVAGDHFAAAGANTRVWNALQKAAEDKPDSFIDYYANPVMHAVSEAWLGPHYQMTAQVNVVHPGGQAQQPHRDFPLGFQTDDVAAQFPLAVHRMSPLLTLQGAVAHSDMPVATGPTQFLPFSHQYELGYLAWRDERFKAYFAEHSVQLPLSKGDQVFFNPALFHAAGTNHSTDHQRMVNLLQVSSAFGVPMETLDHDVICQAIYPTLQKRYNAGEIDEAVLAAVIATAAQGYSFPTNLDTDPPIGGLAPQTGQQLLMQALQEAWTFDAFKAALEQRQMRRSAVTR